VKVLEQVAKADMVASRWSVTARQRAEFMGAHDADERQPRPESCSTASATIRSSNTGPNSVYHSSSRFLAPSSSSAAVRAICVLEAPPAVEGAMHLGTSQ
jgi:hypothetical protein